MHGEKIIIHIDDEDILELIPDYLQSRSEELIVLKDASMNRDSRTIGAIGHKLKGSGGAYGLDHISELGNTLEKCAKLENWAEIDLAIADLQNFVTCIEIVGP